MTTNASGHITIGNIPINTKYYYQEVETVSNYVLDNQTREIIIDGVNNVYEVGVINYTDTSITIIKKDSSTDDKILSNAKFNIYDNNDNLLYTKITDKLGKIIVRGLGNGKYYAKEVEAPDGYISNKDKHPFEITDSNKNVEIVIYNKPDNPNTGDISIFLVMMIGITCLVISIYQYKKYKNVEFM